MKIAITYKIKNRKDHKEVARVLAIVKLSNSYLKPKLVKLEDK